MGSEGDSREEVTSKTQRGMEWINKMKIAHFRVALSLSIKARPGAQPFI